MPEEDNISTLHKNLTKKYKDFTVDSATFRQDMQDEGNLRSLWENLGQKSPDDFTVDWDTFKGDMVGRVSEAEPIKEEDEPAIEPSLWGNVKEEASQLKESLKSNIEAVKGLFGEAAQPEEPEEPATPELSPEQLEEEVPEGSWERDFHDRSEQMKTHVADLGVDEVTYEVADVLHSLQNALPGELDREAEKGYLGGGVNSLYKAMGRTLHEWQNIAEVVDDGTGNILSVTQQMNNPKDPRNKRLLEINKAWRDADTPEEKEKYAKEYRKFRRETSSLEIAANWLEGKAAGAFKEMPETMRGDMLTGLANFIPFVLEMVTVPEARIYGTGVRMLGAAKPLITSIPKLMTLEGFKGFFSGVEESIEGEYTGAKKILTPYKRLGLGAANGMYMHSIGVGSNMLGGYITKLGLGKATVSDALKTRAGQLMFAGSSAPLMGTGFGLLGAQQYYAENVGKMPPEELRAGMKRQFGVDFGIGLGLSIPAVGKIAGISGFEKVMDAARERGFKRWYSLTPELIKTVNMFGADPFELRKEAIDIEKRMLNEKKPERRKELEALLEAKNTQIEANAVTQDLLMNPEWHFENIKRSPLTDKEKKLHTDRLNKILADNDPLIKTLQPFKKEGSKIQAKKEVIEQNDQLSPEVKKVKLEEITKKEKGVQEKIDKAVAKYRGEIQEKETTDKKEQQEESEEVSKKPSKDVSPEKKGVVPEKKGKPVAEPVEKKEKKYEEMTKEELEEARLAEKNSFVPEKFGDESFYKEIDKKYEKLEAERGKRVEAKKEKTESKEDDFDNIPDNLEFTKGRKKATEGILKTIEETREKLTGKKGEKVLFEQKAKRWRTEIIGKASKDIRGRDYDQEYVTKEELDIFEERAKKDLVKTEQKLKELKYEKERKWLKEVDERLKKPEPEEGGLKPWDMTDKEFKEEAGWANFATSEKQAKAIELPSVYKKIAKNEGEAARDLTWELNKKGVITIDTHVKDYEKDLSEVVIQIPKEKSKTKEVQDFVKKHEAILKEEALGDYIYIKLTKKGVKDAEKAKKETPKEAGEKEETIKKDINIIRSVGAALEGFGKKAGGELNEWVNSKKQQALIGVTDKKAQTKIERDWEKKRRTINTLFGGGKVKQKKRADGTIDYSIQGKNIAQEKQRVRMMKDILKMAIQENRQILNKIHGRVTPALLNKVAGATTAISLENTLKYMEEVIAKTEVREELKAKGNLIDKIEREVSKKALQETKTSLRKAKGTLKSSISPEYIDLLERVRYQIKEGDPVEAEKAKMKIMDAMEGRDEPLTFTERQKIQELDFAGIWDRSSAEIKEKLEWVKDTKKGMRAASQVEQAERAEKRSSRVVRGLTELIPKGKKLLEGSAAKSIKKRWHKGLDFLWDSSWQSLLNKLSIYRPGKEMPGKEWQVEEFYKKTIKLAEDAEIIGQEWHKNYKLKMYEKAFGLKGSKLKNKMDIEGSKEADAPVEFVNAEGNLKKEYLSQRTAAQKWLEYRNPELQENFHLSQKEGGMGWTKKTVEQLEAYLKPEWKTLANEIAKSYEMLYDRYNPAHRQAFSINMAKTKDFVPIYTTNNRALPSEVLSDGMLEQPISQIMNTRHMKSRVNHKNPLAFVDILDVYNTYFTRMEKFRNWHEPVNELKHFYKDPKIKEAIRQFHGSEYNKIIDWFIKRFEGVDDVWMKSAFEKGLDRWTTNVTKGILYANRSVGIKQAISTTMYLIDTPPLEWAYGIGLSLTRLRKTGKEFEKGAFLKGRGRAYFDIDNVAKAKVQKGEFGRFLNTVHAKDIDSFLGMNIKIGDRIPMYTGGYAHYRYKKKLYRRQHPNWSEERIHKEAFDSFELLSEKTQQSLRTSNISYLRGTHAAWRTISMFTSGAGQIHRITASAAREILAGRNVYKNMRTILISHVLMGQLFTLIGNNLEWDWKDQKLGLVIGNAAGIAVGGKLISSIRNTILKKPWARGLGEEMSAVVNLIDDIGSSLWAINTLAEEKGIKPGEVYKYGNFMKDEEVQKEFKKLIAALAVARGIPANELEDIFLSAKKIGRGETEHPILEGFGLDSDYSDEQKIWEPGGFRLREKER